MHAGASGLASVVIPMAKAFGLRVITTVLSEDFAKAIEMAPEIKPFRHTYLHEESYRKKAIELLDTDEMLKEVLK